MSSPYSGASAGAPQGYAEPVPQNYAADYTGDREPDDRGRATRRRGRLGRRS